MASSSSFDWQTAAITLREDEIQNSSMLKGILKTVYQHVPWTDKPQEIYAWELVLEDTIGELEQRGEVIRRTGFSYGRKWLIKQALQKVCAYADHKSNLGERLYGIMHGFNREL